MVIGIDLDNTIIDYNNAFRYTALNLNILSKDWIKKNISNSSVYYQKSLIKKQILSLKNGNYKWEALQGQVYGRYIHLALIFPGVVNFLIHCKNRSEKVHIISHKTDYGHHDYAGIPLRKSALGFLKKNNLLNGDYGITIKDIIFCNSRKEKVNKISELKCNYFIDDLIEVFEEPEFPENTKKILFDIQSKYNCDYGARSWREINKTVFSKIEKFDIAAYVENGINKKVKSVKNIKGRGNSDVYKIEMESGHDYAGKYYPDMTFDCRKRLLKESNAYKFLHSNKIELVPKNIFADENLNFGLNEWINGLEINQINDSHINSAVEFIYSLAKLSKETRYKKFSLASSACISGKMIEEQIIERYSEINEYADINLGLRRFLEGKFSQYFKKILTASKKIWPGSFEEYLQNYYQFLSPSDFGFHNALLTKDSLFFFDFEYFGWDDPVKLSCDFILNPGMSLTNSQKKLWLRKIKDIFSSDTYFKDRLRASYCLYGLCWCLIQLKIFCEDDVDKRNLNTSAGHDLEKKQTLKLTKSNEMLNHLNEVNKFGFPFE